MTRPAKDHAETPQIGDDPGYRCPSAAAESSEARVFGVVLGASGAPRVEYFPQQVPFTRAMESQLGGLHPGEVFRFTSPCVKERCIQYSGHHCRLGERVARGARVVEPNLAPCAIRDECRWFAEQGGRACYGCSRVVTELPVRVSADGPVPKRGRRHLPLVAAPREESSKP